MQLESHATPPQESPQQRRAALHRAIERGLDSDEVWNELATICLELGLDDEAQRCVRRLTNPTLRLALESKLVRRGRTASSASAKARPAARSAVPPAHPARPAAPHAAAPAASDAGQEVTAEPAAGPRADRFEIAGLYEHLLDAVQFLFQQHMPWLVLLTTLAFPLVVGVGGFLTAGDSPLLLAALAALPGICVLAVVGAMGRRILVASSEGGVDVPALGDLGPLVGDARRFLCDASLVLGALLAPSLVALALHAPLLTTLPGLLLGLFFTPIAWALRQVRRDLGALSPVTLVRGVARCGLGYVGIAILCVTMFVPAGLVAWAVFGRPVFVQIAVIGPLCVLPLFVVSRLLGTWLDSMRLELGVVLLGARRREPRDVRTLVSESMVDVGKPRFPRRPDGLAHFEAPSVKTNQSTQRLKATRHARAKGAPAAAAPAPAATPAPAAPAKPAAAPAARSIEGRGPRRAALADSPDLSKMPGAVVVSGQDRVKQGAAARPR